MALSNSAINNFVQVLYPRQSSGGAAGADPTPGNNVTTLDGIFRAANDGDREALMKVCGGEGGPDFVITGNNSDASAVTFDIPLTQLLKLYAAQVSGVTRVVVKAKVTSRSAAVATSGYWEIYQCFDDIAGTMTAVGTQAAPVAIEGGATTDPTLTISSTNLRVTVTTLAAAAVRAELFVTHVQ